MGTTSTRIIIIFCCVLLLARTSLQEKKTKKKKGFSFDNGFTREHQPFFFFSGQDASIDGGALQLTPDTINDEFINLHHDKSGRIMYHQPFTLWFSDDDDHQTLASFNSTFLINVFRKPLWDAGHGLAFLIAPDSTLPDASYGQWLGLTNATTDGNPSNRVVAIEFDTEKQDFDPDDNHIGLNINSVRSRATVSLDAHNITISPDVGTNLSVWVDYDGVSKVMEVYMARQGVGKPEKPLLAEPVDLREHLKQDSYFGFAASTGNPQIQLNCVLKWSLEIDDIRKKTDRTRLIVVLGVVVPVLAFSAAVFCILFHLRRRRRRDKEGEEAAKKEFGKLRLPGMPREFKYKELKKATNNFDESMKLGEGGFGIVYRGILPDSSPKEIAVKKFSRDNIKSKGDFLAELTIIHHLRHKNLVRLVGWCHEKGKLLLAYDFMPNGSLEKHLYVPPEWDTLHWALRFKILVGIASALHYLHNEYDKKVVHRDLKASNILLDSDYNARLGDFGLARTLEEEKNSYAETGHGGVPGTLGYVAPECFHTGSATPESDVYGFGAVVLEVVCGRSPGAKIQQDQHLYTLVDWVWMLHREGRIEDAVDERLGDDFRADEAKNLLLLGLACSHPIASERPRTEAVLQIMTGTLLVPDVPPFKPVFTWPSMNTDTSLSSTALSSTTQNTNTLQTSVSHLAV